MNAILNESYITKAVEINDPKEFDFYTVKIALLQEINSIRSGIHEVNRFCKCSHFSLADSIHMALKGELFHGYGSWDIESLVIKMTKWLFSQIVEINENKK